jgi:hypothetical protein
MMAMKKPRKNITEIKDEIYDDLGGKPGAVKYYKRHPSAFYPDYFKTQPQPVVTNNVAVSVINDGEAARRELETAFMRVIAARKHDGDPAVYVDGERIDGRIIEHQPATPDPRPSTPDHGDAPLDESSSSPQKGPLNGRGGVATITTEPSSAGAQNKISKYSTIPGIAAGAALDESTDDNLSTTERFYLYSGRRERMP